MICFVEIFRYLHSMFEITFLRHGESTGNAAGQIQGQQDMVLNERGRLQAQRLAQQWHAAGIAFDYCISSPLLRARETAEIITVALTLPLFFDPIWMERSFGELEGLTVDDLQISQPDLDFYHPFQRPGKTGESLLDLYLRTGRAVQDLLMQSPGRYLIVSHGAILNMALYIIFGLNPQGYINGPRFYFGNTGHAKLTYEPGTRIWRFIQFVTPDYLEQGEQ